jgi:hypothetical protein
MTREIKLLIGTTLLATLIMSANLYIGALKLSAWQQTADAAITISSPLAPAGICDSNLKATFSWQAPKLGTPSGYGGIITDLTTSSSTPWTTSCSLSPLSGSCVSTSTTYSFTGVSAHLYRATILVLNAKTATDTLQKPLVVTLACPKVLTSNQSPIFYDKNQPFIPAVNISVSVVSSVSATLAWPRVVGAVGYGVYVDNILLNTTTGTSYNTGEILLPGTEYTVNILSLRDLKQANSYLAEAKPKAVGFWSGLWSSLVAAVGNVLGTTSQPAVITKTINTPDAPPLSIQSTLQNPVKVLAILLDYKGNNNPSSADSVSSVNTKLFGTGQSVKNYYKETSYGKFNIDGEVIGTGLVSVVSGVPDINASTTFASINGAEAKETDQLYLVANKWAVSRLPAGKSLSSYGIIIYVWSHLDGGQLGVSGIADSIGPVGGEIKGRIWINGIQPAMVYAHEIGHKLGLYHANGIVCQSFPPAPFSLPPRSFDFFDNCKKSGYYDEIDVMGNKSFAQLDPYRKNALGWIPENDISSSGRYTIAPTESPSAKMFVINHPIKSDTEGYSFYLDYRRPIGFDAGLKDAINGISVEITSPFAMSLLGHSTENESYNLRIGPNASSSSQYVIRDGEAFYTVLKNTGDTPPVLTATSTAGTGSVTGSGAAPTPVSGLKIIQINHDNTAANVYVRFDAVPKVSISPLSTSTTIRWTFPDLRPTGGYEVYRDSTTTPAIYSGSNTTFTDTNLAPNTEYTYYIRAYDAFSELPGKKYFMPFSEPVKAKTLPAEVSKKISVTLYVDNWMDSPMVGTTDCRHIGLVCTSGSAEVQSYNKYFCAIYDNGVKAASSVSIGGRTPFGNPTGQYAPDTGTFGSTVHNYTVRIFLADGTPASDISNTIGPIDSHYADGWCSAPLR